jgi:hypothetical protein
VADTFVQQCRNPGGDHSHADNGQLAVLDGHGCGVVSVAVAIISLVRP